METAPEALSQEEFSQIQALLNRLIAAFKVLQILGQVLKNFPGSLHADRKLQIATECYKLGFRALSHMVEMLREGRRDIVEDTLRALRAERPDADEEKILREANSVVVALAVMGGFGIVKRISTAVGSPDLTATYGKVAASIPSTATHLTNMAIRLEQVDGFPRGELVRMGESLQGTGVPQSILRWLVMSHVNLFPVNFQDKQKVFEAVGIKYSAVIGSNLRRRMLKSGS